jgi:hypothetical protein
MISETPPQRREVAVYRVLSPSPRVKYLFERMGPQVEKVCSWAPRSASDGSPSSEWIVVTEQEGG